MDFEYSAWGSSSIVVQVLRAVALLGASNELLSAILAATLLSFCALSLVAALRQSGDLPALTGRLVLTVVLVTGVLLVPARMIVSDRFDGQDLLWTDGTPTGDVVVANVPLGVALPGALASALGVTLTRVVETSLGMVDDQERLSASGLWLSARALRAMLGRATLADSTLAGDFRYFLTNCTQFDVLAERVSLARLRRGEALDQLDLTAGGLTSVHLDADSPTLAPVSCGDAWFGNPDEGVTGLSTRIAAEGQRRKFQACQQLRGIALALSEAERNSQRVAARNPTQGAAATCGDTVFARALSTFGFVGTVGDQFSELVALGLLQDSAYALSDQDPQALGLATLVAQRQRNAGYVIAGELAAAVLPALRGALEAVVLLLLPVLLIVGMLFFDQLGLYLKNGLVLVIWLHMWPPVMAVVNGVGQWVQEAALNEHVIIGDGRFTLQGINELLSELDTQLALSRYMLVLVPMIAWALVRSGEMGASLLAARLLQPGEQAAATSAAHAATNNWSLDQVQMQPRTTTGPHVAKLGDAWGATVTRHEELATMELPSNQPGYVAASHSSALTSALTRRAEQSRIEFQEQRQMLSDTVENAYEHTFGNNASEALRTLREQGVEDVTAMRALESSSELWRTQLGKRRTIEQGETTDHTWHAGLEGSISTAGFFAAPLGGIAGALRTSQRNAAELSESMQRSFDSLTEEQKSAIREVGAALQHMDKTTAGTSLTRLASEEHQALMREGTRDMDIYTEAAQRNDKLARASEYAASSGQAVVRELMHDPENAGLLAELHQLQHVEGMPFDQAWPLAQERSGVRIDLDRLADRLLASEIEQVPQRVRAPGEHLATFGENRARVEQGVSELPADRAERVAAGKAEVEAAHAAAKDRQPPRPGDQFYDDARAIDKTIYDEEGRVERVVADESLYEAADRRMTENFKDALADRLGILDDKSERSARSEDKD